MLQRTLAVVLLNLRTLPARWGAAIVVVICLTGVSGVLVSMLAMAQGIDQTFSRAAADDRVVVLATGQITEASSTIGRDQAALLRSTPGLKRGADGAPVAMLERFTLSSLTRRSTGTQTNLVVRGVGANVLDVRPETRLISGRMFTPGLRELVAGRAAAQRFVELELGNTVTLSGTEWSIVGLFEDGGSPHESEVWGDVEVVMTAYHQTHYSSMTGQLESAASFQQYKDLVTANPQLAHTPQRESDYLDQQSGPQGIAMRVLGYFVASIMGLGAVFAAVNTMYASVESRTVEIATLRALGFRGGPIVLSVLLESMLLCSFGALIGGGVAWLLFNGYSASTTTGFSLVAFTFNVSPGLLGQGVAWACVIGLVGGIIPALRAARMPIVDALRAV